MKRILALLLLAFLGTQIMGQDLNINGTVFDEDGLAVPDHEVFINVNDSAVGFNYSAVVSTNEAGAFSDVVTIGDATQGEAVLSTESCNTFVTMAQYFNPGNYDLTFDFVICTDTTGGGGNDSIVEGCENYFYYNQLEGLEIEFFGVVEQEGDVVYSWVFGDGTTGDGETITHIYNEAGSYNVNLHTTFNDTCEYTSSQTIILEPGGGNDSTYCVNDFSYIVNDYTISLEGWVSDGGVVEALYWDFGDGNGNSAEGLTAVHTYSESGIYNVTFTTVYSFDNDSSCTATTTKSIFIDDQPTGDFLYGTVRRGEAFLDYGIVQLFSIVNDTVGGDDDIILFDETTVDSAGMYYFGNVPSGNYLILAQADQQSIYFDQTVPTYYGDVINWTDATIITLGDPMNPYDINLLITDELAGGDGEINGDVVGDGFKSQLIEEDIIILLLDENYNALSFTLSELDSNFDFSELGYGNYIVYAEVVGITTEPGMVTLSADNPTATIQVLITPDGITTGLDDINDIQISGNIYPNPVGSLALMELNILESSQVELVVLNQMGQVLQSKSEYMNQGMNKVELNTESYPAGVYFIQIRSEKSSITQKFIKK